MIIFSLVWHRSLSHKQTSDIFDPNINGIITAKASDHIRKPSQRLITLSRIVIFAHEKIKMFKKISAKSFEIIVSFLRFDSVLARKQYHLQIKMIMCVWTSKWPPKQAYTLINGKKSTRLCSNDILYGKTTAAEQNDIIPNSPFKREIEKKRRNKNEEKNTRWAERLSSFSHFTSLK